MRSSRLTLWLTRASPSVFACYSILAAFSTYFCMYAYRKPFAVGAYEEELVLFGLSMQMKIALIVFQVLGYTLSKFLGIKFISEMTPGRRMGTIAVAIGTAELALLGFGLLPTILKPWCLFLNGLALGVVWGLVFGFLEGRKQSDLLGAGLAASFIVASGFVKTVGKLVIGWGVSENWMPAVTGALFALPTCFFLLLLGQIPPPSAEDERLRLPRQPMEAQDRRHFFVRLAPGLILLTIAYVVLTAYRDFRDNFARELWDSLGYAHTPSILTTAELPVAAGALLFVGLVTLVRDNKRALTVIHGLLIVSALLIGGSTWLFSSNLLSPASWMILVGLGLYMGYVPYNCVLFDRLMPAVGVAGTAGFMIYVTDSFGYLGSVALLLIKSFGEPDLSWLEFFRGVSYVTAAICLTMFCGSLVYFRGRRKPC